MALLKVGDVVYKQQHNDLYRFKIDRVTETQAISGDVRFDKDYSGESGWVRIKGKTNIWDSASYYIADAKLDLEYEKQQILYKIKSYSFAKLNIESLREIEKIIHPIS